MIEQGYELLGRRWRDSPHGLLLPTCGLVIPPPPRKPTKRELYGDRPVSIDLFCGAGGCGLGTTMAGFDTAEFQKLQQAAEVLKKHHGI